MKHMTVDEDSVDVDIPLSEFSSKVVFWHWSEKDYLKTSESSSIYN